MVTFGSTDAGNNDIYRVEVSSGRIDQLTTDPSDEGNPSYSRDGRWLYFASNRSGEFEIYRMPSSGGEATQVTKGGGRSARESHDGQFLYYHRGTDPATLFRLELPLDGGEPTPLFTAALYGDQRWFPTGEGIYYVDSGQAPTFGVYYFDFATATTTPIYEEQSFIGDLTVSPDETRVFFARVVPPTSELWQLEAP